MMKDPIFDARAMSHATRLWRLYGFCTPKDLVPEDLAFTLGLIVLHERLDTADARLVHNGKRGIIRINRDIAEIGRKRFAITHEIGHWLMHKGLSQFLACTNDDMLAQYKASNAEYEANRFAAELTMPEHLFTPAIAKAPFTHTELSGLADEYEMTLTATAMRYLDLTSVCCAFAISVPSKIKWWRGSKEFERRCWITAGKALSAKTAAAKYFETGKTNSTPEIILTTEWLEYRNFVDANILACTKSPWSTTIQEQVVPMPRYGQAMSLLSFP